MIGPPWVGGPAPRRILCFVTLRAPLERLGLLFVDPIADGWFADRPDLVGGGGKQLIDEGHVYLADKITAV